MRAGLPVLALLAVCHVMGQTNAGSSFRIHVVDAVTRKPIAGTDVVLDQDGDQVWGQTDAQGIFAGHSTAGQHLLTVRHRGYRLTGFGLAKTVDVKANGETDATVEMQPLGILTGRVLDQFGDPVRNAIVRTEDEVRAPGQAAYYESYATAATDDRGEYRLAEVPPGKHYVAVEFDSKDEERTPGANARIRWPRVGGLILYPDATDISQAQQVEVMEGETARLIDIHLTVALSVTIAGRITPPPSDKRQAVSLQRRLLLALHSSPLVQAGETEADGNFKIEAFPGTYVLTASDAKTGRTSKPLMLEVREKNISNLVLELGSAYEVRGRFVVDGAASLDFSKLLLNFGGPMVKIDGAGTFLCTLPGGKGVYTVQGLPEGWYVKSVVEAGRQIAGTRQIEVDSGTTDLVFTLSPRAAHIEISLRDTGGVETQMVALLPDRGPIPDPESLQGAQRDEQGRFILASVPPGSYRVFALNASNWVLLMNPAELMEKYRSLAPLIEVLEGDRRTVAVTAAKIPE